MHPTYGSFLPRDELIDPRLDYGPEPDDAFATIETLQSTLKKA